jgi:hypothetical protein
MIVPSDLLCTLRVSVRHYSDGDTYISVSGEEMGEMWSAVCPGKHEAPMALHDVADDIGRILVAWAEMGPLGVSRVIDVLRH